MELREIVREIRGNVLWDASKELTKLMMPMLAASLAGWLQDHAAVIWASALFAAAAVMFIDRLREKPKLQIDEAKWTCVNYPEAFIDLKDAFQGMVHGDSLRVFINNDLGDPCTKLHPELGGHGKLLHMKYSRGSVITKRPNEWLKL